MRRMILTTTALVGLASSLAHADAVADGLVQSLQGQGYTNIEVLIGPTQIKIEAYQPGTKIEAIHDLVTGAVLKLETETLESDDDEDFSPKVEIEDVAQDFLDSNGKPISDDEALNDPLANQITDMLLAAGFTSVVTLIGPTQILAKAAMPTGEQTVVIYDRATGAVLRETATLGQPDDDDFAPGVLIEDVSFDFLDSEGNPIIPQDADDLEEIEEDLEDIAEDLEEEDDDDAEEAEDEAEEEDDDEAEEEEEEEDDDEDEEEDDDEDEDASDDDEDEDEDEDDDSHEDEDEDSDDDNGDDDDDDDA